MREFRKKYEGENSNLYLIRKYGTEEDKKQLRGSGYIGDKPLSKEFYQRLKKNKELLQ